MILGTLAQNRGHKAKILHLDIEDLEIQSYKPDLVGITCNTFQVRSAREAIRTIRESNQNIKIVLGGPHACVWDNSVDEIVVGEGENRWLEILREKPDIKTLEDIPPIDYGLVDMRRFTGVSPAIGAVPSMVIMASRGCPNQCTFCNTPVLWGRKVRYQQPQYIVDEVERLHKIYGMNEIFFQDDTFNLNLKWASEIFEGIIQKGLNREMVFRITGRVNHKLITKEYLDLAHRAGVWNIFYGIESGSQYMLDRMKKNQTVEEIERAVRMTHEANITTTCSFVVGLPGESQETIKETDRLINRIKPSQYGWCFACPFPKTEFREEVIRNNHIMDKDFSEYSYGMLIVRTEKLSYNELSAFKGFTRR